MLDASMYSLGEFTLDVRHQRLIRGGQRVDLAKKPYAILVYLVANRDRLVTREELLQRFWHSKDVYEQALTRAIARIRSALGEARGVSRYIETRWATGYQYIGPLREILEADPQPDNLLNLAGTSAINIEIAEPLPVTPLETEVQRSRFSLRRILIFSAGAAAVLAAVALLARDYGRHQLGVTAVSGHSTQVLSRKSVAVMPLENLKGDSKDEWLGPALAEMISTDLSENGKLRVVPGSDVTRAETELRLKRSADLSKASLADVGRDLFADLVVTGSYVLLDSDEKKSRRIRVDLRIEDARTGDTLESCSESGKFDELFEVATAAESRVIASLASGSRGEPLNLEKSMPADPEAMREYMEGLSSVRAQDPVAAEAHLEMSIAREPDFPLAHLTLADVWGMRGYQEKQRSEAKLAESLSGGLDREQRLLIEGRYASTTGDWEKAVNAYRALYTFFPDNIEYGLALANTQTSAGKPQEARRTLQALQESPAPLRDDPRIDLAAAGAAQSMSESQKAADAAQLAMDKAKKTGAVLLYARALAVRAGNMAGIDITESIRDSEEVKKLCTQLNDIACLADDLRRLGVFRVNSDPDAAEANFRDALRMARKIGNLVEEDNDLNGLAAILSNQGDYKDADSMYRDLLHNERQMNSDWGVQMALNNLGNDLFQEGRAAQAKQMQEEALGISRRIGLKAAVADELLSLSQINLAEGNLQQSKQDEEEAISIFNELRLTVPEAVALSSRGDVERVEGKLEQARNDQQQAVNTLTRVGAVAELAESRLALARFSLESGEANTAVNYSQSAAVEFARQKRPEEEACARARLALGLAQRGKRDEARREIHRALTLISEAQGEIARDEVQIDATLLQARSPGTPSPGETERAEAMIGQVAERAAGLHLALITMDARAAQAELRLRSSSIQENETRLHGIEKDARMVGYVQLARRVQRQLSLLSPEERGLSRVSGPGAAEYLTH